MQAARLEKNQASLCSPTVNAPASPLPKQRRAPPRTPHSSSTPQPKPPKFELELDNPQNFGRGPPGPGQRGADGVGRQDFAPRGTRGNFTLPGRAPQVCMPTPIPGPPAAGLGPKGTKGGLKFGFKVEIQKSGHGQPSGLASSGAGPNPGENGEGR